MADKDDGRREADTSNGIMDIADTPDVAVWSKGIRKGMHVPSDNVKEPSKIASTTLHVEKQSGAHSPAAKNRELMIDPADEKEVAKAAAMDATLTDESDPSGGAPHKRKGIPKTD